FSAVQLGRSRRRADRERATARQCAGEPSSEPDLQLAKEACAVAAQCAPYCHPRLARVEARIDAVGRGEVDVDVISQEERLLDLAFGQLRVLQRPKVIEAVEIARPGTGDDGEDRAVDGR